MENDGLSILDKRTNTTYEVPFHKGTIRAMDLRKIKTGPDDFGLMTYDPAFMNTASCHSAITYIDGDKGILRYRGYPIEQLAEKCTFLEVAYLLLQGELPTASQLKEWINDITHHTMLHETTKKFLEGFRWNAHPMGMFISTVAALSTVYPESRNVHDAENAATPDLSPDRQSSHHRRLHLPPRPGLPVRLSRQRPELCRELHEHAVEDGGAQVSRESRPGARARHPVYPARRPRAELQHQRHALRGQLAGRPLRVHGRGGRGAFRSAARRRQRRSAEDARRDRFEGQCAGLH